MKHNTLQFFKAYGALLVLALLIGIGGIVRLYQIDSNPVMLNRDEAALAYNAYLLKETGTDEWQRSWPLALESFGDYKLPGYVWMTIVTFTLFGVSDWSVRLPAALAGIALIPISFWFARRLRLPKHWSLWFAFLVTFTPVFVFYSRMAWEAMAGLLLTIVSLGLIWFKPQLKKNMKEDIAGVLIMVLAVFTYNTPFLVLPFFILLLPLLRGLGTWKSWLVPVVGLTAVLILAAWIQLPISQQKSGITLFSDQNVWLASVEYRQQFNGPLQTIVGNKYVFYLKLISERFLASFSPRFLVTRGGDHPWHQLPGFAHYFWEEYLVTLSGLLALVFASMNKLWQLAKNHQLLKNSRLSQPAALLISLLLALVPAIITVDAPHATRSLLFIYLLLLIGVVGISKLSSFRPWVAVVLGGVSVIMLGHFYTYANVYITEYPQQSYFNFHGGYPQIITKYRAERPTAPIAVVDGAGFQYIITAWYLRVKPEDFYATIVRQNPDRLGFRYGQQLLNFHFIANDDDRSHEEGIVIEWQEDTANWKIKEY